MRTDLWIYGGVGVMVLVGAYLVRDWLRSREQQRNLARLRVPAHVRAVGGLGLNPARVEANVVTFAIVNPAGWSGVTEGMQARLLRVMGWDNADFLASGDFLTMTRAPRR